MTKLELELHLLNAKHRVENSLHLLNKKNYILLLGELEDLYEDLSEIHESHNKKG